MSPPRNTNISEHPHGTILESDSPEPSLLKVHTLDPKTDYRPQSWKNGLGATAEIGIYPPEKDFKKDSFFWRFSINIIQADCNFSLFPGYDCTVIVLPNESASQKVSIALNHQGTEVSTNVQPLFPYTWEGEWSTMCKVSNAPVTSLQFMVKRDLGFARFLVEKLDSSNADERGNQSKSMLFGAFALVYVIDGYCSVRLDENYSHGRTEFLEPGQSLYLERDEEASPTDMILQAADAFGETGRRDLDATVVIIQIAESKTSSSEPSFKRFDAAKLVPEQNQRDVPSLRRNSIRRSSLVVYPDQPLQKLPADVAQKLATMEISPTAEEASELANQLMRRASLSSLDESARRDSLAILRGTLDPTQMYEPPAFALLHPETEMPPPIVRDRLVIEEFPKHTISTAWIKMMSQGLNEWIRLPVIVCRGSEDGPVVGITAAVHGNELNGVPCIHRVTSEINVNKLNGTVVAVPCVNVVGYLKYQREFADGRDLNRLFPGKEDGFASQVYCFHLMNKIISQFNYMIDLHTASFGRINSYYVRADMNDPGSAILAHLQQPQIVLHNSGQDGTLRSAASARGIKAITVEIGNPQLFQNQYVQWSFMGVMRILDHLNMFSMNGIRPDEDLLIPGPPNTILCSRGFWIYTKTGGVLEVYPGVNTIIRKGDIIARVKNMFGNVVDEYYAPCSGIVIGRSSNPVAMAGDRIVHLGVVKRKGETLPKEAKENY
ncbi:hypothetical protein DFQ28_002662 [Apophysomyces sp. BC1034]|nr:hypothetical protein DFQ29_001852 [Apophysomyces sp. BC1021]KAG0189964.1 hypothetical protein DFQ28_002662 [Apophysomyces sp. BC1034]